MKRKNFQILLALLLILTLISFQKSYSQWTIAGNLAGITGFPSISVVNQNIVWVAGYNAGLAPLIFRTINGGTSWTPIPTTGISLDLFCVWGIDSSTAYVGDGGLAGGAGGNAKFYKTTNAGGTWTTVASTGGNAGFINGIVFSKTVPSFGIAQSDPPNGAGQPYYISKTTNGGNTWTPTSAPGLTGAASAQNSVVVIDSLFYGFGLNAGAARVYFTSNGGTSWTVGNLGVAGSFISGFAFSNNKLIGIAATDASLPSIARTTNGGSTWSTVNTGAGATGFCSMKFIDGTNTCYLSGMTGTTGVIKKSTDGGVTWTTMTTVGLSGVTHMEFRRIGTTAYGYAITASGAVLKATEIVTEVTATNNLIPEQFKLEQNYPNPFNPSTTINFSIPTASKVTLKVYDALGKEVATLLDEFKPAGNYSSDFIAASNLTSGVYFYTLTAGNFTDTKKLMLVK